MSAEYVEIVRRGYERFVQEGSVLQLEEATADFAWDMTNFSGWPEQPVYEGLEGMEAFLSEWTDPWEGWRLEIESLHDGGDKVVAVMRQHGRSKLTGMPLDMQFAQVWTFRDGLRSRMEMYSDVDQALCDAGVGELG